MKKIRYRSNLTAGIVSIIFGVIVLSVIPSQISLGFDNTYGFTPRTIPFVFAGICILFGALLIVQSLVLKKDTVKEMELSRELKALAYMAVFVVYSLLFNVSFVLATILLGAVTLMFLKCKKPLYYAIVAVTVVFLYFVLTQFLHIQLP